MKLLATSKLLCALLAFVAVGMGVQTFYLVQVHRQLGTAEVRAQNAAAGMANAEVEQTALLPADPQTALAPDPISGLARAEERMRDLFDDFYGRFDRDFGNTWFDNHPLFAGGDSFFLGNTGQLGPRVDLQDRGDRYEMTVDIPGADEADVVVRVEDDTLIVEGSRATTTEESKPGKFVRRERQFGRFERRLALPEDADAATLRTEFENGVLRVGIQKQS